MRRSAVLLQQHAGKLFLKHWKVQGTRVVRDSGALRVLKERGIQLTEATDLVAEKPTVREVVPIRDYIPKKVEYDSTHPDYQEIPCFMYTDSNVLLEGLDQAKVLTNTVELEPDTLPDSLRRAFESKQLPQQDKLVRSAIKSSLLYDAYQEKLPRRHDPEREAWIFPREYGITDRRKNLLLSNRLMQLCTNLSPGLIGRRVLSRNAEFRAVLRSPGIVEPVLLSLRSDILVSSQFGVRPQADPALTSKLSLPDISPLLPVVSLEPLHFYQLKDFYPLTEDTKYSAVHTSIVHYNETEVGNLYETEVTEKQILGRSLLKAYTFALAQARTTSGPKEGELSKPIVVQCVQTDGRRFHFSVFQLNTTSTEGETRNVLWSLPFVNLYEVCDYVKAIPTLEGYNPDVFKWLLAFYNNS